MQTQQNLSCRHFLTYTGVKLPLKLVSPLEEDSVDGRITFFRGYYDDNDKLISVEKVVYGEVEFEHHYQYHADGRLKSVEMIEADEDPRVMQYD